MRQFHLSTIALSEHCGPESLNPKHERLEDRLQAVEPVDVAGEVRGSAHHDALLVALHDLVADLTAWAEAPGR